MKQLVELTELINTKILKVDTDGYGTVILTTDKGTFEITTFVEDGAVLIYKTKDLTQKDIFVICSNCNTIMPKNNLKSKCSKCSEPYHKSWRTGTCTDKISVSIEGNSLIQNCYIRVICEDFIEEMRFDQHFNKDHFEGNLFPDLQFETLLSKLFSDTPAQAIRTNQVKLPYIDLDIPDEEET